MENSFKYVTIAPELVHELLDHLVGGESVVVLGHRNSGKIFLGNKITKALAAEKLGPVITVRFQSSHAISSIQEAHDRILQAAEQAIREQMPEDFDSTSLLGPILWVARKARKKAVLVASNVDAMAHFVARQFLKEVRAAVVAEELVVLVTGEYDLRELVDGPTSEFNNVAHQYVLQGFGEEYFQQVLGRYAKALGIRFDSKAIRRQLWEMTGGNTYALRVLLWIVVEKRARGRTLLARPVNALEIAELIKRTPVMGPDEAHLLRTAIRLVPLDPGVWEQLRLLTTGSEARLEFPNGPPGGLTLSGVAKRVGPLLQFASPLMKDLACRYYDDLRMGDLYAGAGKWTEAFEFYRKVDPIRRLRPSTAEVRAEVIAAVRSLAAAFHSMVDKGIEEVCRLFAYGCRYLLGFPEAVFWRKDRDERWSPAFADFSPSPAAKAAVLENLTELNPKPGCSPARGVCAGSAFVVTLESPRSDLHEAVMVGDFETKRMTSRERERLLRELSDHFLRAHAHAARVEKDRTRLRFRNEQTSIINDILARLGEQILDVHDILKRAATGLRTLGYRRIGFCLVDSKGEWIEGVLDESPDPSVDLSRLTRWRLEGEFVNVHQKAARTGEPEIVADAWNHPLTNKEAVATGELRAFAVIPLLDTRKTAIGTILIERHERIVPSPEEVEDFIEFGRQLAAVLEHGLRLNLLQESLDKIPEPLLIVDPLRRVRYANRVASTLLPIPARWHDRHESPGLPPTADFQPDLDEVLNGKKRVFRHVTGVGNDPSYRGALLCASILDWRERVAGALLHIEDMNPVFRLLKAFKTAAEAADTESLLQALLDAMKQFGHTWGRLYLIHEENDCPILVSKLEFGFQKQSDHDDFISGKTRLLPRTEASEESWLSLTSRRPIIFWRGNKAGEFENRNKLKVIGVPEPKCPSGLAKPPDSYWLDFPLVTADREIGKITLQTDENLTPEHFEFLKVLCEMASGLLDAFLRREHKAEQRADLIRVDVANRSLALLSHNIATRFAGLDPLIARYGTREKRYPDLKEINSELREGYRDILIVLTEAKFKLQMIRADAKEMEAVGYFKSLLARLLPDGSLIFDAPREPIIFLADKTHLTSALTEIVENSRQIVADPRELKIEASVSVVKGDDGGECVHFVIKDNGPGVEPLNRSRIFEEFFTHRPGRDPGTGLGLALARRVIEAHGGHIRETGSFGSGARFEIDIPRRTAPAPIEEELRVPNTHR